MKKVFLPATVLSILTAGMLTAQAPDTGAVVFDPNFFAALIGGIILAIGFQLVLTNLAAAGGLSILHTPLKNVREDMEDNRGRSHESKSEHHEEDKGDKKSIHSKVRMVSRAYGLYTVIATSIALFFATWLAVELSGTVSTVIGVTNGLAVWGLLYVANLTLQMRAVSSLSGSLLELASSGIKGVTDVTGGILGKSSEKKASEMAAEITSAVRDEIFHDVDVKKEIGKYIAALKPDYAEMRKQFEGALSNAKVETTTRYEAPTEETSTSEVHVGAGPSMKDAGATAKAAASKVQDIKNKVQGELNSDKDKTSQIADAAMEVTGLSREQAEEYRSKVENYLRNTGKDELNPDGIKRDIEQLLRDPKGGFESLKERVKHFDSSTVTALLSQRKDMNPDEANKVVNWVTGTIDSLKSKFQDSTDSARESAENAGSGAQTKVKEYFENLDRPELRYEDIKADFNLLFHDPKAGADALLSRMKSLDRDTLKALVASTRKDMSEEDADKLISRIEDARNDMIERAERMKREVARRVEQAKEEAVHQADEIRKTAASAAWWVFTTAVVSGLAAAAGGWIATMV